MYSHEAKTGKSVTLKRLLRQISNCHYKMGNWESKYLNIRRTFNVPPPLARPTKPKPARLQIFKYPVERSTFLLPKPKPARLSLLRVQVHCSTSDPLHASSLVPGSPRPRRARAQASASRIAAKQASPDGSGALRLGCRPGDRRGGDERRRRPERDHRARYRRAGVHHLPRHARHSRWARTRIPTPFSVLRLLFRQCASTQAVRLIASYARTELGCDGAPPRCYCTSCWNVGKGWVENWRCLRRLIPRCSCDGELLAPLAVTEM
jgi:hypothetical protein